VVSPRLVLCLFVAVAAAILAFGWTLALGGGFLLAMMAYSLVGTVALLGSTSLIVMIRSGAGRARGLPPRLPSSPVTARSG
jgi:hypothetical protein